MTAVTLYLAIAVPALALLMGAGALVLTKRSHDRYKEALLSERADAAEVR